MTNALLGDAVFRQHASIVALFIGLLFGVAALLVFLYAKRRVYPGWERVAYNKASLWLVCAMLLDVFVAILLAPSKQMRVEQTFTDVALRAVVSGPPADTMYSIDLIAGPDTVAYEVPSFCGYSSPMRAKYIRWRADSAIAQAQRIMANHELAYNNHCQETVVKLFPLTEKQGH